MKVYKVWVDCFYYDEYDSCVIVAENEDKVKEILKQPYGTYHNYCEFDSDQGEIHIKEVDLTKEDIICSSFNAG